MSDADYLLIRNEESTKMNKQLRSLKRVLFGFFAIGVLLVLLSFGHPDDVAARIFFLGLGFAFIIGSIALYFWEAGAAPKTVEIAIDKRVEEARLEFLKSKMTLTEWENYKIQLENNALLKDIKANQNRKTNQGPGISYGVIDS